ncbi:unnamed protein product, partial [Tuber aestivum]
MVVIPFPRRFTLVSAFPLLFPSFPSFHPSSTVPVLTFFFLRFARHHARDSEEPNGLEFH